MLHESLLNELKLSMSYLGYNANCYNCSEVIKTITNKFPDKKPFSNIDNKANPEKSDFVANRQSDLSKWFNYIINYVGQEYASHLNKDSKSIPTINIVQLNSIVKEIARFITN